MTGAAADPAPVDLVRRHLADPESAWSIGTRGAVAEFFRVPEEPAEIEEAAGGGTVVTRRGALAVTLDGAVRVIAYETPSRRRDGWRQGVAFCLPEAAAGVPRRDGLTRLGSDAGALRPRDREAELLDLGLSLPHVEACVRTGDAGLLAALEPHVGQPLLAGGGPAVGIVRDAHPHRIFRSRLGRLEVYQAIAPAAAGGRTPEGPHTHLLPALLAEGRTHDAGTPIPDGYLPCLMLYPASPVSDDLGRPIPFDATRHAAFQALMEAFGDPDLVAEKRRAAEAIRTGVPPARFPVPEEAPRRDAVRVALRQLARTEPALAGLDAWRATHDGVPAAAP